MDQQFLSSLPWLRTCPADFGGLCREALTRPDGFGERIKQLAGYALDENQSVRLATTIERGKKLGYSFAPLATVRLGIAANGTWGVISPALIAAAARWGMILECVTCGFDQALQDCLSPDSSLNRAKNDFVLIAPDWRALPMVPNPGSPVSVDAAVEMLDSMRRAVRAYTGATCLVQNLVPPPERTFGSLERMLPGTTRNLIDAVNSALAGMLDGSGDSLVDAAFLAECVGSWDWHSSREWNFAKFPFSQHLIPLYADFVIRIVAARRGLTKRCLILDLDNTVWGGVIGDDGLKGIRIGQGDPSGEAYLSFQKYVLSLRERGVVLAVSSKNEDPTARQPFRDHPDMLLREEHIAVFQANWNDKATNIRAIADTLSLGFESIVFVDDNPFERNQVRAELSAVTVPEMPEDPADYARVLSAAGYFESVTFSEEDANRAAFYTGNAKRAELAGCVSDTAGYLESLGMEITFQPFDQTGRVRITQLINKSNQFNLTSKRYSEAEVERFEADPNALTMQIRLRDKFGDNGMISVVICRSHANGVWDIDTWLMSCRVLGRRVEQMVLLELARIARCRGIGTLRGYFRPTGRNKLVEAHYADLGFTLIRTEEDGSTEWEREVGSIQMDPPPMAVHRSGFDREELAHAVR